jgi:hypothetical protein
LFLRRLRGVLTTAALWAIPWSAFGLVAGVAYKLGLFPTGFVFFGPSILGGIVGTLGIAGAIVGAVNGAVFATLLLVAERKHHLGDLRAGRTGIWGGLATGATVLLILGSPYIAAGTAVIGFLAGAGSVRLAQRGEKSSSTDIDVARGV